MSRLNRARHRPGWSGFLPRTELSSIFRLRKTRQRIRPETRMVRERLRYQRAAPHPANERIVPRASDSCPRACSWRQKQPVRRLVISRASVSDRWDRLRMMCPREAEGRIVRGEVYLKATQNEREQSMPAARAIRASRLRWPLGVRSPLPATRARGPVSSTNAAVPEDHRVHRQCREAAAAHPCRDSDATGDAGARADLPAGGTSQAPASTQPPSHPSWSLRRTHVDR